MTTAARYAWVLSAAALVAGGCRTTRESSPPDIAYPNVNPPELKLKLAVEQPEIGPRSRVPPSNRARVAAEEFFPVAVAEKLERRALPADRPFSAAS